MPKFLLETLDANHDGYISYAEYLFFISLLSIPDDMVDIAFKMFDADGNGVVDANEFAQVMKVMRKLNPLTSSSRDAGALSQVKRRNTQVMPSFFGPDGKDTLSLTHFKTFMARLHSSVLELEFRLLDPQNTGSVLLKDFALTLVSYGDSKHVAKYSKRVESITKEEKITFDEFLKLHAAIDHIENIDKLAKLFLSAGKPFGKNELKIAAKGAAGVDLDDHLVDLIFKLFDENENGKISLNEFVKVLKGRKTRALNKPRDFGATRFFHCFKTCASLK